MDINNIEQHGSMSWADMADVQGLGCGLVWSYVDNNNIVLLH